MATGSGDITPVGSPGAASNEEDAGKGSVSFEDGKGEAKKKKFKPLEKMMKFFKSGKKRSKSKEREGASGISVKAKSTSALHKDIVSEDEDDGGFSKRLPMGGSRSISEDSVFHPEQRDPSLAGIRKTAVSMENIKQDFRSELFSKLKRRRAMSSDDEIDDDTSFYLYSTSSSYNAADIVMGRPKPLPAAGKSHSEDSDISFGGSDNDTEDLFKSKWQDAIGSSVNYSAKSKSLPADSSLDMDFNAVKLETKTLINEGAKHKISIKPKARRASSMHHRGTRPSAGTGSLPQLKEESPVKEIPPEVKPVTPQNEAVTLPEPVENKPEEVKVTEQENKADTEVVVMVKDNKTSIQITAPPSPPPVEDKSPDVTVDISKRRSMIEEQRGVAVLPTSPDALQGVKLRRQRPKSLIEHPRESSSSSDGGNELAKAFQKRLSVRKEKADEEVSIESFKEPKKEVVDITTKVSTTESKTITHASSAASQKSSTGVSYMLKKEPLRKVSAPEISNANSRTAVLRSVSEEITLNTDEEKSKVNVFKKKESDTVVEEKTSLSVEAKSKSLSNKLPSPREDYRLKRQSRSKTLPEQPVTREILDAKMSANTTPTTTNYTNKFSRSLTANKPEIPTKTAESYGAIENKASPTVSPVTKRSEPKRLSFKGPSVGSDTPSQPSWIALAKKKQMDSEENRDTKEGDKKEPLSSKSSSGSEGTVKPSAIESTKTSVNSTTESTKTSVKDSTLSSSVKDTATPLGVRSGGTSNFSKSFTGVSSLKSSGTSSKEEKEKINGNKKGPESVKKEPEPVQRSLSTRTKAFDSKNTEKTSSSSTPSSSVPQWKKDLVKKRDNQVEPQVKIEIIEKGKPVTTPKPIPAKKPTKALDENSKVQKREKTVAEKCGDAAANRQSKVLDMVKNFQKLQVS